MKLIRRILQLYETAGLSYRQTGDALNIPYTTVADYVRRYKRSGLTIADLNEYSDREIYQTLFKDVAAAVTTSKPLPDFAMIHEELKRRHVTRLLLWEEYRAVYPAGCRFLLPVFRSSSHRCRYAYHGEPQSPASPRS